MSEYKTYQSKLLHIVLNDVGVYSEFVGKVPSESFDEEYRPIAQGIYHASVREIILTPSAYEDFIKNAVGSGDYQKWTGKKDCQPTITSLGEKRKFVTLQKLDNVAGDEFGFLATKVQEYRDRIRVEQAITEFKNTALSGNFYEGVTKFAERASAISSSAAGSKFDFANIAQYKDEWFSDLKERRVNKVIPLSTGLADVDEALSIGLDPGSLSFFVADAGGGKTTMMLNIALNVFKQSGENVLFISLEMPKKLVMMKIVSRETGIDFHKLLHAHLLTEQELEKASREMERWEALSSQFVILDAMDGITVADIGETIRNHASYYKPRVVILDYLTILKPEPWYAKQPSHSWYGHMCKSIRTLGKKHGFAVISAAQLGRDALKRLKTQKEGSQSVGSEDVRGSHDLSADADSLFILVPLPSQPNEKIQLFCAKSRYGDKSFGGKGSVIITIKPSVCKMYGERDATWSAELVSQPKQAGINYDQNIDINADIPPNAMFDFDQEPTSSVDIPVEDSDVGDSLFDGF